MTFLGIPLSGSELMFIFEWILAGYVMYLVFSAFGVRVQPKATDIAIDLLLLSLLNFLLFAALIGAVRLVWPATARWLATSGGAEMPFVGLLAFPALLGFVAGVFSRSRIRTNLFRTLGLPGVYRDEFAYDHVFANPESAIAIIITYDDGTQVLGKYAANSFAATDPERSEIYLEEIFTLGADGGWESFEPKRSAVVKLAKVRLIEVIGKSGGGQ